MPDTRSSVKLDFITGLDNLPPRPQVDASTTMASVNAGRELGFAGRAPSIKIDGRRLRGRGATTQLNIKVTAEEKEVILREAMRYIQDPASPITTVGEFVIQATEFFKRNASGR
jgi:hypothetical protein